MTDAIKFAPRDDKKALEEGKGFAPKFGGHGLIPAIVTDAGTGELLMMAWMNETALLKTIETGEAHYWSRSRQELWHKGATSGHTQKVMEMRTDCDQDAIWLKVEQKGAACHVGYKSCFYRSVPVGKALDDASEALMITETKKAFDPSKVYGE